MPSRGATKRPRPVSNNYNESSDSSSASDNESGNAVSSADNMLAPQSGELVEDFGALAWAPWGARHYPGMVVSGWRCHLRPARPGWRWLLWLAEGKVSEVAQKSLLPLSSQKALVHLPAAGAGAPASGSMQQRGLVRLLDELLARGALTSRVALGRLRESLAELEAGQQALLNGGDGCRLSEWAERCLDSMRERHRRSYVRSGAPAAQSRPVTSAAAAVDSDSDFEQSATAASTVGRGCKKPNQAVGTKEKREGEDRSGGPSGSSSGGSHDNDCLEVPGSRPITDQLMRNYRRSRINEPDYCLACGGSAASDPAIQHPVFAGQLCQPCSRRVNDALAAAVIGVGARACSVCAMRCACRRPLAQAANDCSARPVSPFLSARPPGPWPPTWSLTLLTGFAVCACPLRWACCDPLVGLSSIANLAQLACCASWCCSTSRGSA
ncbi:hypothetical protein BOX15_Mlig004102g2 [Macrostomum lignano]|uniref:DNMT3 cysteine rich ADD domain-containing protein n=1 Tax=Macrostomum lignano TaxID=282301 RepID=A0A267GIE9_9PLAT|nr:hypothetical protein BOX15_Mlig004102g2 [Macrostomum lignano]